MVQAANGGVCGTERGSVMEASFTPCSQWAQLPELPLCECAHDEGRQS